MRILIADDARVLRTVLRGVLQEAGHDVVAEAVDGPSALAAARRFEPAAAIVDGRLPPNAVATIASLRDLTPQPAVYVIAALAETELVRAAAAAGAAGVILRPLLARRIVGVLRG